MDQTPAVRMCPAACSTSTVGSGGVIEACYRGDGAMCSSHRALVASFDVGAIAPGNFAYSERALVPKWG